MEQTAKLNLPYIMPAQAQKHVTHNEALRLLDGLVHLSVVDRDLPDPAPAPGDGDCYLVAAGASGAWSGWDGAIAYHVDGAWERLSPVAGWRVWVEDEGELLVFDGSGWRILGGIPASGAEIQNAALVGVGTTADGANPLSVKVNRALLVARTTAEGGDGDLVLAMSKEGAGGDVGLVMQSGFSTRATMGLLGSDDWRLSVSADGVVFRDAIVANRQGGGVSLPGNAKFLGRLNYDQYIAADGWAKIAINEMEHDGQNAFDTTANRFTAPAAGLYAFGAALGWKQNNANVPAVTQAKLVRNGSADLAPPLVAADLSAVATDGTQSLLHLNAMALLAEGDTVELQQWFEGLDGYAPAMATRFWGHWLA